MNRLSFKPFALFPVFFVLLISCSEPERDQNREPLNTRVPDFTAALSFERTPGDTTGTVIRTAVADTEGLRSQGLMDVHHLPEDSGMLFIFDDEELRSFWMANTPIPLDIIFADASGRIVRIQRNTRPYSHESIQSDYPAMYVVEVNAGYTVRHDINEGMFISFRE